MSRAHAPEELTFFDLMEVASDEDADRQAGADAPVASPTAAQLQQRVADLSALASPRSPKRRAAAPAPAPEAVADSSSGGGGDEERVEVPLEDETLTIAAFYERVRRALSGAFPEEVWVTGEIRGMSERRGHRYLELADQGVDSGGRNAAQQLEVVCWAREWPRIEQMLSGVGVTLEVGRVVRVRGHVSVWEGGSRLRFTMHAIDVEALLGGIAAARRRLLQALAEEDLLDANRRLALSLVPLRVGLVTSNGSEAHRDFVGQLQRSGFAFEVTLEQSLVQGSEAPRQIAAALGRLASFRPDLAVVVRGGGGRGDLAAFDSEEVARAIATAPFPVWTGIGHTGDRSVADEVAHASFITPTACGEAVVGVVCAYRDAIAGHLERLAHLAGARLDAAGHQLLACKGAIGRGVRHQLARRSDALASLREALGREATTGVARERARLDGYALAAANAARRLLERDEREQHRCAQLLRAYDPRRQLERGWSLTHDEDGRLVRSVVGLRAGTRLRTRFADGEATTVVDGVTTRQGNEEDGDE